MSKYGNDEQPVILMVKVPVYSSNGKSAGETALPEAFSEEVRADLVARAAISDQSEQYQPKGADPLAGLKTSARYRGRKEDFGSIKNHGISMLPREVLAKGKFGKVRRIPSSVKGRRAFPPQVDKKLTEKVNKKEYAKALRCALAASASHKHVLARGHKVDSKIALPIVLDASTESISKTQEAQKLFMLIGLSSDLARSKISRPRSGVGSRKGGVRRAKSLLVVVENTGCPLYRSARNIAGVDVVGVSDLKVLDLAPGAKAGRLAAYTQSALEAVQKRLAHQ
ncbi:MAG: 50S ribosomal protein L4 [Candidatus Micrarchaeota archaeon]